MQVTPTGRKLLIEREGRRNHAYPDPASPMALKARSRHWGFRPAADILKDFPPEVAKLSGAPWTCGIGITGVDIDADTHWDDRTVDRKFKEHLFDFSADVASLLETDTAPHEFDALVSLAFNIGTPRFRTSTVLRCHNAGDRAGAARAFHLWNKAKGSVNQGLVNRRAKEATQYLNGYSTANSDLPPTPDTERPMVQSEINLASGAAAVTAGATAVSSVFDAISGKEVAILLCVVVALAAYIIYQRCQQRKGGWA